MDFKKTLNKMLYLIVSPFDDQCIHNELKTHIETIVQSRNEEYAAEAIRAVRDVVLSGENTDFKRKIIIETILNTQRLNDFDQLGFTDVEFYNRARIGHYNPTDDQLKDSCGWDAAAVEKQTGQKFTFQFKAAFEASYETITFDVKCILWPTFRWFLHYRVDEGKVIGATLVEWPFTDKNIINVFNRHQFKEKMEMGKSLDAEGLHLRFNKIGKPFLYINLKDLDKFVDQKHYQFLTWRNQ